MTINKETLRNLTVSPQNVKQPNTKEKTCTCANCPDYPSTKPLC